MLNKYSLFNYILFGDFGLFTTTPKYLFGVLLPITLLLKFIEKYIPLWKGFIPYFSGFGCTTIALASLNSLESDKMRLKASLILILVIPCSSKLAIIATFAAMVSLRVFIVYLLFTIIFSLTVYTIIIHFFRHLPEEPKEPTSKPTKSCVKEAVVLVFETAFPFALGSGIISVFDYFGMLDYLGRLAAPLMVGFLKVPKEACNLFVLNLVKRDFSSAALLTLIKEPDLSACSLVVVLLLLTFSVPCFNSFIVLVKQEKLPRAIVIWLGSLLISLFFGKVASVFLECFV